MSKATKRKYVAKEVEDMTIPSGMQSIVKLVDPRGNNLHEVMDSKGECYLVSMPVKFRRHIWVKRGDYILVEPIPEGDKVKAEITKILTKEHVKYYRSQGCWPREFDDENQKNNVAKQRDRTNPDDDDDDDDDIFVNTNHRNPGLFVNDDGEESSSSDSSDSD